MLHYILTQHLAGSYLEYMKPLQNVIVLLQYKYTIVICCFKAFALHYAQETALPFCTG